MNKIKALIIYVFVALIALLVGMFLNAVAGWVIFFILFFLASAFAPGSYSGTLE